MKSKNSLYNPTLFRKDITQAWPILMVYSACWLILPFLTGLEYYSSKAAAYESAYERMDFLLARLSEILHENFLILVPLIFGLVFAIWLFQYLNQSRSANMMHALPLTRREMYFNHVLAGIVMLLVPELVSFLWMILLLLAYQVPVLTMVLIWYGTGAVLSLFFFSLAVFCVFLSGNVFATVFYYGILNGLYELIWYATSFVIATFGYGLEDYASNSMNGTQFLSPVFYLYGKLMFSCVYDDNNMVTALEMSGFDDCLPYLAAVVLFLILGWLLYRKRKIELAGDFVAVPFVRPVLRWLVAILAGILGALICNYLMTNYGMRSGSVSFVIWEVIFGFLAFVFAQMLIKKSFRVFEKRFFIECGSCLVLGLLLFVGLRVSATAVEREIPDAADVEYATVNLNYPMYFEEDEISDLIAVQENLVSQKNKIYDRNQVNASNSDLYVQYVTISYHLKSGREISRSYPVIENTVGIQVLEPILREENNADRYMTHLENPDGNWDENSRLTGITYSDYLATQNVYLDSDIAPEYDRLILDAIRADAEEGNLLKYDLGYSLDPYHNYWNDDSDEFDAYIQSIVLNFEVYDQDSNGQTYCYSGVTSVSFGEDCTHLISALEECGALSSEDSLITWPQYEAQYVTD